MIKLLALMESLPGMHPGEKILHETFRQTFLLMKEAEEKTAKQFANRGRIERGEFEKLPFGSPDAIGNDGVAMRIKVGSIRTEGLYTQPGRTSLRSNSAWKDLRTAS